MNARRVAAAALALAGIFGTACKDKTPTESPVASYSLAVQGGDGQSGPAGSVLATALQVIVKDPTGTPVRGVVVIFRPASGSGAILSDTLAVTGLDGVARVDARVGGTVGAQDPLVKAFIRGREGHEGQQVTFKATATPGPTLTGSDRQSFSAGDTLTFTGTNFDSTAVGNAVIFGGARGLVIQVTNGTQLRVVVPPCIAAGQVQVRVQVGSAQTNALALTYVATKPSLDIALNTGLNVAGTELGNCLSLPGNGSQYLIVPQFATSQAALASYSYTLGNVISPAPARTAPAFLAASDDAGMSTQGRFDLALRTAESRMNAAAAALGAGPREARPETLEALTLNSTRRFQVLSNIDPDKDATFKAVTASLKYIGTNVYVYVDTDVPSNGSFTDAELAAFGKHFDETLYPIDVRIFGPESDIDGNGHVVVLMTPVVNALTDRTVCSNSGFVTGFFFGWDLSSRSATSNKGEVFYSLVPDPQGERSCNHSASQVQAIVPSTFIHELQHMISYNHHVLIRGGSQETVWLNEGLSHMAEEMGSRYYEGKYAPPTGKIFADSAFPFISGDLVDAYSYLAKSPNYSVTTYSALGALEERGASWLFLRWLADQRDSTILARLVQTGKTSVENIEDKSGETFTSLFGDFSLALYTDSLPGVPRTAIPSRLRFKSRNLRYLFDALFRSNQGSSRFPRPFPIATTTLPFSGQVSSAMVPGTMEFYTLTAPATGANTALRFSAAGGATFDEKLKAQVGIFRLK